MNIKIKKLFSDAMLPTYSTKYSAGADLYAFLPNGDVTIAPNTTVFVSTGLCMEIPVGYAGLVYARSGLASKQGIAPANKVGVIDSDYRGEAMVALFNHSDKPQTISNFQRIAQLVIAPVLHVEFDVVENLSETERGAGGFGSSGK